MYVAVKGGERAIAHSIEALARKRRGNQALAELSVAQIREQLPYAIDRVMAEGSIFDAQLAALAIKQAGGDLVEAIFLLRAYRTTLPRLGYTLPLDTDKMRVERRISAIFKDLPGGQILGPSFDYTQRLLDFTLLEDDENQLAAIANGSPSFIESGIETAAAGVNKPTKPTNPTERTEQTEQTKLIEPTEPTELPGPRASGVIQASCPDALALLSADGLIEPSGGDSSTVDLTREPLVFPADRNTRLQNLARADEGFLLAIAYSTQRGYAHNHPFVGDLKVGQVDVEIQPDELGFSLTIGRLSLTECQMVNQFAGSQTSPARFTRGYGLSIGQNERKAMAMALTDRALRAAELGEAVTAPAQSPEFVLSHSDNLEASGFVQHLKLPHYVDFQAELELIRNLRAPLVRSEASEEEAA